jgi:flagellar basal body rod protein FlgC
MNGIMSIAFSGLQASSARFAQSASRTVSDKDADLGAELVTQKMAETDYRANLAVVKIASRMMKETLDILA